MFEICKNDEKVAVFEICKNEEKVAENNDLLEAYRYVWKNRKRGQKWEILQDDGSFVACDDMMLFEALANSFDNVDSITFGGRQLRQDDSPFGDYILDGKSYDEETVIDLIGKEIGLATKLLKPRKHVTQRWLDERGTGWDD